MVLYCGNVYTLPKCAARIRKIICFELAFSRSTVFKQKECVCVNHCSAYISDTFTGMKEPMIDNDMIEWIIIESSNKKSDKQNKPNYY